MSPYPKQPQISAIPFQTFIAEFSALVDTNAGETHILQSGKRLLSDLVKTDDWLPDSLAKPHPQYYQQYLLYCDPEARFCVVSFVWEPGQETPIHNHMVWGLLGQLRGRETSTDYDRNMHQTGEAILKPGDVAAVSPTIGDIHKVRNSDDGISVSIHVYGADIGKVERAVFDPESGASKPFISGYANA
ncbi:MAG: cysteine dioxygenase [Robiginitomaculum sp.]|nr:MAG: cysteine dioxygenase [Robiginitomaculum sp.]